MSSVPERSEVPAEYKWDLRRIYASDEQWERAYEDLQDRIAEFGDREGGFEDGQELLETLRRRDELLRDLDTVTAYASLRKSEDTREETYQAYATRAESLSADAHGAVSFVEPAILELGRERVEEMVAGTPGLQRYDHYLDDVLRTAEHTRSAEVERLLAELSDVTGAAGEVYGMLTDADMEFPAVETGEGEAVEVTLNNFTTLQKRPDREFRRRVYEAFYDRWAEVRNAVGAAYRNSATADVKLARARDYDTARAAALDGPNVPVEVYDTLVDTVEANLEPLHRHVRLKRRALEVDEFRPWDLYVPVTRSESPEIPYEEATEHVLSAVEPLGEDYRSRVEEGIDSRWVDVYENRGKRSGAFSGGSYDTQPYVLMNYQDDVASMYTLAHELGHSLHSEYTRETQPYVYSDYEIFVAEVASTVNEALLTDHLLSTVEDERLRRHVLDEYLERFRSTLYRQTMFAHFEHRAHELVEDGEALTPDRLDDLYGGLKADYYEPAVMDDRIDREWMRIPHFYRAYYVYQYATGISAAVALAERITEDPAAADRYLDFLSKGSSEYPLELLRGAGVDLSTADPVEAAIDAYDRRLDEMERLV